MKKFLVLFLGALMVLSFATVSFAIHDEAATIEAGSAVAEPGTAFVFGGDARVRGVLKDNFDLTDRDQKQQYWDQRARFTIDVKTMGGVELRTRLTMSNNGNAGYTWGSGTHGSSNDTSLKYDWAYIHFPVGPVTVDVGRQRANYGYKYLVWDESRDRLKVSGKFGNVSVSVFTDKVNDTNDNTDGAGSNLDADDDQLGGDKNNYGAVIGTSVAGWDLNLLYINTKDQRPEADDSDCTELGANCNDTGVDGSGNTYDLYVNGKAGPVGVHLEYVTRDGDVFERPERDDAKPSGAYAAVDFATGPLVVFGAYAFTRGGYQADNDFAPSLLFGTVQATAISQYGDQSLTDGLEAFIEGAVGVNDVQITTEWDAIVIGGFYSINDALQVGARIVSAKVTPTTLCFQAAAGDDYDCEDVEDVDIDGDNKKEALSDDVKLTEVDITASYKLSKNLTYSLSYGNAKLSGGAFEEFHDSDVDPDDDYDGNIQVWLSQLQYNF